MGAIEFRFDDQRGAVLSQSAKVPGKWQVTYFDRDGFSMDTTYETAREAVQELRREGYRATIASRLQQWIGTERFQAGVELTYVVAWTNDLLRRGDGESWKVVQRYREAGLQQAREEYCRHVANT